MFLRNLMAMDAEEMIRAQPMDSVVLIGGCDKTVPALLMAAASVDLPAILEVTGPMITGSWRGERLGACTDCRRFWAMHRAGTVSEAEIDEIGDRLAPGPGTCMVMGTASTMALIAEALGMMLPGGGAIPAVDADRLRHAEATGAEAVRLAKAGGPRPSEVMTEAAFTNALRVLQAIGGSTNGVIHLTAMAGRLGIEIDLDGLRPARQGDAGAGRPEARRPALHGGPAEGRRASPRSSARSRRCSIRTALDRERQDARREHRRGTAALAAGRGAPALRSDPQGRRHPRAPRQPCAERRAHQAGGGDEVAAQAHRPGGGVQFAPRPRRRGSTRRTSTSATETCWCSGTPGRRARRACRRRAIIPIPKKLAAKGVKDMVRISDARMSGTAFGTIVLHISPEAAVGGPLALVETGDRIALDVAKGRLDAPGRRGDARGTPGEVAGAEAPPGSHRGYLKLYLDEVLQAEDGCDFDFLRKHPKADPGA